MGCDVEVKPNISYGGNAPLDELFCEVTYTISGDQTGPVVETSYGVGVQAEAYPSLLTTNSSSAPPKAKVTDVSCM